jgi:undecaprenyl-diphosphatase
MTLIEAIILGIVQGLTEFFPVSSSGHLVIAQELMGIAVPGVFFEVTVHVATLLSVLVVYRARVLELCVGCFRRERNSLRYVGLILLASIPAGIVGVGFKDAIETLFDNPYVVGVLLLVTGALLFSTRWPLARNPSRQIGARDAILIGSAQAFAILPGISRSGSTTATGLWLGIDPAEAAAFSFLMSIPAIAGAAVLQVPDLMAGTPGLSPLALIGGGVAAAVTGVVAIRTFVLMLRNRSFPVFAYYCWAAGALFLGWLALRG